MAKPLRITPIGEAVERMMKRIQPVSHHERLLDAWRAVVGEKLARASWVLSSRRNTLLIGVESPLVKQEIELTRSEQYLTELKRIYPAQVFTVLRVKVAPRTG